MWLFLCTILLNTSLSENRQIDDEEIFKRLLRSISPVRQSSENNKGEPLNIDTYVTFWVDT